MCSSDLASAPLKELGPDPVTGKPIVVKSGRFGPYVTDGETNASLRSGDDVETLTHERAAETGAAIVRMNHHQGDVGLPRGLVVAVERHQPTTAIGRRGGKHLGAIGQLREIRVDVGRLDEPAVLPSLLVEDQRANGVGQHLRP